MPELTVPPDPATPAHVRRALRAVAQGIPQGRTLPSSEFDRRHRWLLVIAWLQVPGLGIYGVLNGVPVDQILLQLVPIVALSLFGTPAELPRRLRASMVALALLTGAAVAVSMASGAIEAHFYFFVAVVLLTLYEDWLPFLIAVGFVVLHHGILGALDRGAVYDHGGSPWLWAGVHGAFIIAAGAAAILAWRLNEDVRTEAAGTDRALNESEQRFGGAFDHATIGMALVAPDGRFLQVNESLCRIVGYSRVDLLNKTFQDITHPDDLEADLALVRQVLEGEIESYDMEKRYIRVNGQVVWVLLSVSLVRDQDGEPLHFVAQIQNITERREVEDELRESEQRFRALAASAPVGICTSNANGECTYVNDHWCELAGMSRQDAMGSGWLDAVHPDDRERLRAAMAEASRDGTELVLEYRYLHANATVVWLAGRAVPMRDSTGAITGYIGTVADITRAKLAQEEMTALALRDDLTGLANRRRFNEELQSHIARCARYGWRGALLSLDLDKLKTVNDALGHAAGDQLIKQAATRLDKRVRTSDFLARIGGDEFAVLLPEADADSARKVAADLVDALHAAEVTISGSRAGTASVGIGLIEGPVTAEELLIRSDVALYNAKDAGGGRVAVYSPERDARFNGDGIPEESPAGIADR